MSRFSSEETYNRAGKFVNVFATIATVSLILAGYSVALGSFAGVA